MARSAAIWWAPWVATAVFASTLARLNITFLRPELRAPVSGVVARFAR